MIEQINVTINANDFDAIYTCAKLYLTVSEQNKRLKEQIQKLTEYIEKNKKAE